MKPRTKVPAALFWDLKEFAVRESAEDMALQLLWLDVDAAPELAIARRAEGLAWVAYHLAKIDLELKESAVDIWDSTKPGIARTMSAEYARQAEEIASLQRRIARVIRALLADRPKGRAA